MSQRGLTSKILPHNKVRSSVGRNRPQKYWLIVLALIGVPMHDVRYELIYPAEGTTEGDYYKLKERYFSLYDEREKTLKNFHKAHQSLVNKDCLLQNFDHLTSYLFSSTLEAIRAEERVLVNGGSLEEALQAYEKMR